MSQMYAALMGILVLSVTVFADSQSTVKGEKRATAKFFINNYSTTTVTTLSYVTTTQPYFCALTAGTNACKKRRLRRKRRLDIPLLGSESKFQLDHSEGNESSAKSSKNDKDGRFFFTLWSSITTTLTLTTTATNRSITLSASAYCTFANYDVPLC